MYTNAWKHPACVAKTGDFNNDGRVDIVLTPAEPKGNTYRIAWYEAPPNPKNAAWTEHTIDRPVETVVHALDVADMNGDGNLDVVVAEMHQGRDPDEVRVFINQGGGRDWTSQVVATTGSHGIRVVDIGNDGDFDIFGANWSASSQVDLWENRTDPERGDDQSVALDNWTYIHVDDTRTGRAFGLTMADLTGDGRSDIVSGKYFYRNPGGDLTGSWARTTFPIDVDGLLTLDVDGDSLGDVIALDKTGKLYWLEATTRSADSWNAVVVGDVGKADHGLSSQGFTLGQLVPGGRPEIIITVGGLFYFEIPDRPETTRWPRSVIARQASEEGIDTGDFDGDGDLDICGGVQKGSGRIAWWENPGDGTSDWTRHDVGTLPDKYADRFHAADLNGDKRLDIVVSAANGTRNGVYWWEGPNNPTGSPWIMHTVVVQATTNSMDVADMDQDGDIDIISGEHRGTEKVAVWENDGRGRFTEHVVSTGKESHLGTRVADLDGDGDLDIVSIAWDDPQHLHVWRNDAKVKHVPTPK